MQVQQHTSSLTINSDAARGTSMSMESLGSTDPDVDEDAVETRIVLESVTARSAYVCDAVQRTASSFVRPRIVNLH
jgi:hypothetical protein